MLRTSLQKVQQFLIVIWHFLCQQPIKTPADIEEKLSGIPETQAQRMLRRWQRSRARSIE
jgi:hypothetical protein